MIPAYKFYLRDQMNQTAYTFSRMAGVSTELHAGIITHSRIIRITEGVETGLKTVEIHQTMAGSL